MAVGNQQGTNATSIRAEGEKVRTVMVAHYVSHVWKMPNGLYAWTFGDEGETGFVDDDDAADAAIYYIHENMPAPR